MVIHKSTLWSETVKVPDLDRITQMCEFKAPFYQRVDKVSIIVLGHGDYPADLGFFVKSPLGTYIPIYGNIIDEWSFFFTAKTIAFKGEKISGTWWVDIVDLVEGDENFIDSATLIIEGR